MTDRVPHGPKDIDPTEPHSPPNSEKPSNQSRSVPDYLTDSAFTYSFFFLAPYLS